VRLYDKLQPTADRLITQFGEQVTFTRTYPGAFNPATGAIENSSTNVSTVYAVPSEYNSNQITVSSIQSGDLKLRVTSSMYVPNQGDAAEFNNENWVVVDYMTTRVNGLDVTYSVQIRK